jgi:Tfp pilus assembly protein PilO
MNNRNLLIGAGVLVVGYLLYTKSKKDELKKRLENMKANKRPLWEA